MADPIRSVTRELRPLAKHLASKGVEFEHRGGHVYATIDGKSVTVFTTGRSTDSRSKKNTVAMLKREWPQLLEGFESFVASNGDEQKRTVASPNPGGINTRKDWADGTRMRLRTCIKEHFGGSHSDFVRWAEEVAKERELQCWPSLNAGQSLLGGFLKHDTVPKEWALTLLDAAIDAAYGTPEKPATVEESHKRRPTVHQEPKQRHLDVLEGQKPLEDLYEEALGVIEARDAEIAKLAESVTKLEEAFAAYRTQVIAEAVAHAHAPGDPKERYIELLFTLAEQGNEQAMDRIERLLT